MKSHKRFQVGKKPLFVVSALLAGLIAGRADAAILTVTNTADPGVGGCTAAGSGDGCTLREAIIAANNQTLTPGADTIDATKVSGIITLATALPAMSTIITLNGPGAARLTVQRSSVSGTPEFRIFTIDNTTTSGPTIVISGLTITGGKVSGSTMPANCGGGIYNNHGTLTVSNSILKNNAATNGGAICNNGSISVNATLRLNNSTLTANVASAGGGGIFNNGSGGGSTPLAISNSIFTSNRAVSGGAILNDGHAGGSATITELSNSVISGNTASGNGGAIENDGRTGGSATLVISYTTVSGNTATNGGAINNNGTAGSATQAISFSTFDANRASVNGGAINNDGRSAGSATLAVKTSTFYANTAVAKGSVITNTGTGGSATVEIDNSTLKSNTTSVNSAAIDSDGTAGSATLALGSTILANAPTPNLKLTVNSETTFTSKNHNLSSDAAGGDGTTAPGGPYLAAGGDRRNTDAKLDAAGLQDNGGLTKTIALLPGSPAIDQGISNLPTDQRGATRPYDHTSVVNASGGNGSDIGAFELGFVPTISISSPRAFMEGSAAAPGSTTFSIKLSQATTHPVRVNYQTVNGTASAGSDYVAQSGILTFAAGQISKTLTVNFVGDAVAELSETFFLDLKTPVGATILNSRGAAYIGNDDGPSIFIDNAKSVYEGNSGTTNQSFVVRLSAASTNTITVDWANAPNTAGPADYVTATGSLTFAPGETQKTIVIQIKGDTTVEPTETYRVNLTRPIFAIIADSQAIGYILNDDTAPSFIIPDAPSQ